MKMEVIPAINCLDSACVREKLSVVKSQLPVQWLHFDVSDGKFTPVKTWNKPEELKLKIDVEIHLMVHQPVDYVDAWLKADAKRIIVHLEAIMDKRDEFPRVLEKCSAANTELMLALNPGLPVEAVFPYLDSLLFVQFLAVKPGPSGQKFDERVLEKIKVLRERAPDIVIEVDGGINPETARKVKEAGADIVVSASYIFGSENPQKAYQKLVETVSLETV